MTDTELKQLKDNLWHSADMLRAGAHLAANKYGQPILGLIFLRYADVLFKQHKDAIDNEYDEYKGTRMEKPYKDIAIEKCGFFLPENAYFDYINDALQLATKYDLDVREIVLQKLQRNAEKYPVDKARGTAKKYNQL